MVIIFLQGVIRSVVRSLYKQETIHYKKLFVAIFVSLLDFIYFNDSFTIGLGAISL